MTERFLSSDMGEIMQPERDFEFVNTKAITFTSPPGGGSSTVATIVAERLQISENVLKVGEKRREFEKEMTGKYTEELDHSDPLIERKTDEYTRRALRHASSENPWIIEAQLGGVIATMEEEKARRNHKAYEGTVRFLFTVDEEIGAKRVKQREEAKGRMGFSVEDWKKINKKRHAKDVRNWRRAYPELKRVDPHDGTSRDRDGEALWKKYYDFKIDTTFATPEEIANQVILALWENGYISKRKKQLFPHSQN